MQVSEANGHIMFKSQKILVLNDNLSTIKNHFVNYLLIFFIQCEYLFVNCGIIKTYLITFKS